MGADPVTFLSQPWQCTVAMFNSAFLRCVSLKVGPISILSLLGLITHLLPNFHIMEYCLAAVDLMCFCCSAFLSSKLHCFPLLDSIVFSDLSDQFSSQGNWSWWVSTSHSICYFHDRICKYVQVSPAVTSHMDMDTNTIACFVYILWTL